MKKKPCLPPICGPGYPASYIKPPCIGQLSFPPLSQRHFINTTSSNKLPKVFVDQFGKALRHRHLVLCQFLFEGQEGALKSELRVTIELFELFLEPFLRCISHYIHAASGISSSLDSPNLFAIRITFSGSFSRRNFNPMTVSVGGQFKRLSMWTHRSTTLLPSIF